MPPDASPEPHDDAAGWALGALDPDDAAAFETHLHDCTECQTAVAEFASMTRALKSPAPSVEPPPDLGARTLAAVQHAVLTAGQAEQSTPAAATVMTAVLTKEAPTAATVAQAVAEAKQPTPDPEPSRMSKWWHWHWNFPVFSLATVCGAAAAAVVAVVVSVGSAAPALAGTTIPLSATTSTSALHPSPSGRAVARKAAGGFQIHLTVKNLPPLKTGQFYECWYTTRTAGPGPKPLITAGTFTARTGTFTMWSAADPKRVKVMEITVQTAANPGVPGTPLLRGVAK